MRSRLSSSLFVASAGLLFLACGGGDSETADEMPASQPAAAEPVAQAATGQLPEGVTQAMVEEGRTLFNGAGTCFACHGMDGVGSTLGPAMNDGEWLQVDGTYESIVEQIKAGTDQPAEFPGVMLPRAGTNITDAQVDAVAAYVYSLSH
jgi:mono/diheme cytochrome c family protein